MSREGSPNIPFGKNEVEDYEKKRYRAWDQRLVDQRERKILKKILDEIGSDEANILDLPSGYGRFSDLLLKRGFHLVSGDISFHMVKRAKERNESDSPHSGVVADAKAGLPFKKGTFDIILSMRFFHHVPRPEERELIFHEFSVISAKWVILSYYQKTLVHLLQRKLRRRIRKSKRRISMLSKREFHKQASRAGLRVIKIYPLFKIIHAHQIALLKKTRI